MARPLRSDAWSGMGVGWAITSTLIAGMLVMGALGYLIDALFGTEQVFTGIGFVLGAALGIYAVYLRYGRGSDDADG
jgi:ATP synthase protein I